MNFALENIIRAAINFRPMDEEEFRENIEAMLITTTGMNQHNKFFFHQCIELRKEEMELQMQYRRDVMYLLSDVLSFFKEQASILDSKPDQEQIYKVHELVQDVYAVSRAPWSERLTRVLDLEKQIHVVFNS